MKDYILTKSNINEFFNDIQQELERDPAIVISSQSANTGKWGMARLWRSWMNTTAKFMSRNGATMPLMIDVHGNPYGARPFDKDDSHKLFTSTHLGVDENGIRLSWRKSGKGEGRPATKGERWDALRKHENWCIEKGILLLKPRDSEYEQLTQQQES